MLMWCSIIIGIQILLIILSVFAAYFFIEISGFFDDLKVHKNRIYLK